MVPNISDQVSLRHLTTLRYVRPYFGLAHDDVNPKKPLKGRGRPSKLLQYAAMPFRWRILGEGDSRRDFQRWLG